MKIVTVNVPESYIDLIEKLIGEDGLYPSRSELIRCAVREFLLKELELAKRIPLPSYAKSILDDNKELIMIPKDKEDNEDEPEFKTFRVLKKLDSNPNSKPKAKEVKKKLKPSVRIAKKRNNKPIGNPFHPEFEGSRYI